MTLFMPGILKWHNNITVNIYAIYNIPGMSYAITRFLALFLPLQYSWH
jgi:hypothetical protein